MNSHRQNLFPVPNGFHDVLREFSSCILRDQPEDILHYGMIYFESKLNGSKLDFEGPRRNNHKRKSIQQQQQDLSVFNSLFETSQFKQDVTGQNFQIVKELSGQSSQNYHSYSRSGDEQKRNQTQQSNGFFKQQASNDLPDNIPNIRLLEKSSKKNKITEKTKSIEEQSLPSEMTRNQHLGAELKVLEFPVGSTQSLSVNQECIKNHTSMMKEESSEGDTHNNLSGDSRSSKQKTNLGVEMMEMTAEIKKQDRTQASEHRFQTTLTQPMSNFTLQLNDLTLHKKNNSQSHLSNQLFELHNFSQQQQIKQTNIFEEKLLFQGIEEDFKLIDQDKNAQSRKDDFYFGFDFLGDEDVDMEASGQTIQSNYNIQSQLRGQIMNYIQQPPQPPQPKIVQELFFSNDQMKISMVESMNMGAYQKSFIYVNIMSARNLPLCMNATCEIILEDMPEQRIVSHPIHNNNEPDWYYLKKKLVLLVPKNAEKIMNEINEKPLYLVATIYETKYKKKSLEKITLATFRIPLNSIFEKEGQWSINDYFDCQEEFQQSKLYLQVRFSLIKIQNSSLLKQQLESLEVPLNPESDRKLNFSRNRDLMASVDLNKENDNHTRIIQQLMLSLSNQTFRIQGTLKIVIIKARQLKHVDSATHQVHSPLLEYTLTADEGNKTVLHDPNANVAEEPIWFHTSDHKIDVDLSHKPILSIAIFDVQSDEQEKKQIYIGEIKLDLSIAIGQPAKWIVNNYYDLNYQNNTDQVVGQVFIQSKFIPGGLEELHQEQFGPLSSLD